MRLLEELDLKEGEEAKIEVKKSIVGRTFGLIQLDHEVIDEIIEDTKYGSTEDDDFEDIICRRKSPSLTMPVTKLDDKGRILLPSDLRQKANLKEGDEFAIDSLGEGTFIVKKIDLQSLLEEAIEKAKGIDHDKVEREIEEESNRLAKKRFEVRSR